MDRKNMREMGCLESISLTLGADGNRNVTISICRDSLWRRAKCCRSTTVRRCDETGNQADRAKDAEIAQDEAGNSHPLATEHGILTNATQRHMASDHGGNASQETKNKYQATENQAGRCQAVALLPYWHDIGRARIGWLCVAGGSVARRRTIGLRWRRRIVWRRTIRLAGRGIARRRPVSWRGRLISGGWFIARRGLVGILVAWRLVHARTLLCESDTKMPCAECLICTCQG